MEPEKQPFLGNGSVTSSNLVTVVCDVSCAVYGKAI
jgi:hypothetical protein